METRVDNSLCEATGCCMIGAMSRSTKGESRWYCFIHMASEPDDWMLKTNEINRLAWLVGISKVLRWPTLPNGFMAKAVQQIKLSQRSDLLQKPSESNAQWGIRLENEIAASCNAAVKSPDMVPS